MSTSASTPKAVTVWKPRAGLDGWPLTYVKEYSWPSEVGMSSITPKGVWLATRAILSKRSQRAKSRSRWPIISAMMRSTPSR